MCKLWLSFQHRCEYYTIGVQAWSQNLPSVGISQSKGLPLLPYKRHFCHNKSRHLPHIPYTGTSSEPSRWLCCWIWYRQAIRSWSAFVKHRSWHNCSIYRISYFRSIHECILDCALVINTSDLRTSKQNVRSTQSKHHLTRTKKEGKRRYERWLHRDNPKELVSVSVCCVTGHGTVGNISFPYHSRVSHRPSLLGEESYYDDDEIVTIHWSQVHPPFIMADHPELIIRSTIIIWRWTHRRRLSCCRSRCCWSGGSW